VCYIPRKVYQSSPDHRGHSGQNTCSHAAFDGPNTIKVIKATADIIVIRAFTDITIIMAMINIIVAHHDITGVEAMMNIIFIMAFIDITVIKAMMHIIVMQTIKDLTYATVIKTLMVVLVIKVFIDITAIKVIMVHNVLFDDVVHHGPDNCDICDVRLVLDNSRFSMIPAISMTISLTVTAASRVMYNMTYQRRS
jgi:hypothetical protein